MRRSVLLAMLTVFSIQVFSQTPGMIVEYPSSSGRVVLDPNFDAYVSNLISGFSADDETESEIPYVELPGAVSEPNSDPLSGPACGFTDLVTSGDKASVYSYLDASNNFLFRFRVGKYAPNSKGYSILIDTDDKFGFSGPNADPNATIGNPGFEIEISLQTNFGVYLYDVDGTTSPIQKGAVLPDIDYSMKSIALTTNCGDADFFYDFFIPFDTITAYFPAINTSSSLRLVSTTVISPSSAIGGTLSDIGGVGEGDPNTLFVELIDKFPPTSASGIGSDITCRSECPGINQPVAAGADVISGTSNESDGSTITVYKNGSSIGTTTVTSSEWSLTGISPVLASTDIIKGTAQDIANSETVSVDNCDTAIVGVVCSSPPDSAFHDSKSIQGIADSGVVVDIYQGNNLVPSDPSAGTDWTMGSPNTITAVGFPSGLTPTSVNFLWKCIGTGDNTSPAGGGGACLTNGTYRITATESGKCESDPILICVGGNTPTETPTITTSPVLNSTTYPR